MKHFHLEQSENNPTSRDKIGLIFLFLFFYNIKTVIKDKRDTSGYLCVVVFVSNAILYENLRLDS